jgi:hypothetical protein
MSNHNIRHMQTLLSNLDSYTQLSVLGSWSFTINAACINTGMRYVPEVADASGIDGFTPYEQARIAAIREADTSNLPALIGLQRELVGMILDNGGEARGLDSTLEFLTGTQPTKDQFKAEYENRRRAGMRPAMPMKTFVDYEYERAMNQHNQLVAKGEHAVRLCDTLTIDIERGVDDLPDWVAESFENKFIEKLHARWEKLEFVRCNPRRRKEIRDAAAADQLQIAKVLSEYGEEPGFADAPDYGDDDTSIAA